MKIKQTIIYLTLGLLLLPAVIILLFVIGGILPTILAIFFGIVSLVFISISTHRLFTKDLLRSTWFWATLIASILVLVAVIYLYF